MVVPVTDARSNANDQIAHAARVLGKSKYRIRVFKAIYGGKKVAKTVTAVMSSTALSRKQVLTAGKALANNNIVSQIKRNGETAYTKDGFYSQHRERILRLAADPQKLRDLPTKTRPQVIIKGSMEISIPRALVRAQQITIDEIDSFRKVKGKRVKHYSPRPLDESKVKKGMQSLVGEEGSFKDWGGEKNDLWTTRLTYQGKRHSAAFAFKGKGTTGKLTPRKMGKNGDQLQRLLQAPADVFLVQYWREIDQSVLELLRALAVAKSVTERRQIHFCVIDGQDSQRLIQSYPNDFEGV